MTPTAILTSAFDAALQAAAAAACLPPALAGRSGAALVLGAGKGAAAMAAAFRAHWQGRVRGMVVTRYGHGLRDGEDAGGVEILEAGHPSPDESSLAAGAKLLSLAASVRAGETLCCLISGGGSALAAAPLPGLTLEQKRAAASYLMRHGADIREINCVRKHLSALKGGRLASAARPATVLTFAISDVPGDNVGDIASGPTVPDATTQADARAILERYEYPGIRELVPWLEDPRFESPKPGSAEFARDEVHLIASARTALDAARRVLERHGYDVIDLGDHLDAEARLLGAEHGRLAKETLAAGRKAALLSGGETRVVIGRDGSGRGGRNTEYLAALVVELGGTPGIHALAADTDGIDGHGDHAGAVAGPDALRRGAARGLDLARMLALHDTYEYFDACELLLKTGPTRTNVNDFRLILCNP